MRIKPGFTLLELLIAFAIGSFVLTAIFTIFYQTSRVLRMVNKIENEDARFYILQYQFERDLSGAFVPLRLKEKKPDEKQSKKKPLEDGKKAKKEFEEVPLEKAFSSTNKGGNLQELTFISSNPLPTYKKIGPRIVRVVYRLVEDKESAVPGKKVFKLLRQEGQKFDLAKYKPGVKGAPLEYTLAKNIKNLNVEYMAAVEKEVGKNGKTEIEYKTFKQWNDEAIKKAKKEKPDLCTFKVSLWDSLKKSSSDFECTVYIPYSEPEKEQGQDKQKQANDKQDQPQQPGKGKKPGPRPRK